jgi:hypothetical protein
MDLVEWCGLAEGGMIIHPTGVFFKAQEKFNPTGIYKRPE